MPSPSVVDSIEQLTPGWFTDILREGGVLAGGESVASVAAAPFGQGRASLVLRVSLEYDAPSIQAPPAVIVKVASQDPGSRQLAAIAGIYETEVRFYQELAPKLAVRLPSMYWGAFEPSSAAMTLVIEELPAQWQVLDALGGTKGHAEAALAELVGFQAPLWDDPTIRSLEWLAAPERTQVLFDAVVPILPAFQERFGPRLEARHMEVLERLIPRASEYPSRAWQGPMAIVHCDFKVDNILFTQQDDELRAAVIDWQAVRLGPPLIDVTLLLTSCLTVADRRRHDDALLRNYHDRLVEAGVKDFTFDDCQATYRRCSLYALLMAALGAVSFEPSERDDEMLASMLRNSADLVDDLDAVNFLD